MSTDYLLSTHSSNPLEAPPADPRNRAFVRTYQKTKAQSDIESDSSEGEKKQPDGGTVQAYHSHLAQLYPEMGGRLRVKGLERRDNGTGKENIRRVWSQDNHASTSKSGGMKKSDAKGKGRAVEEPEREPMFVDLDEDMSEDGVPGIGEYRVLLDDEGEGEEIDDERNDFSQDPAGSGGEDEGDMEPDISPHDEGGDDNEDALEDDVDLDSKSIHDLDAPEDGSSSSVHIPSSSLSLLVKPAEEQHDIQIEITDLEQAVPLLAEDYRLVDRLGSGTFSSVYKAEDLNHKRYDNTVWGRELERNNTAAPFYARVNGEEKVYTTDALPKKRTSGKVYVAIKRIYVTSGPERIRNEITIMEDCRGCRHTSQLITAFRERDQVVAVMPYCRNEDFRHYFRSLPLAAVKQYFRCMFRALHDIHVRGVIHRDVKPANFLFDPCTGVGTLCDFGLASRMDNRPASSLGQCLHTGATRQHPHGKIRSDELNPEYIKKMQKEARAKSALPSDRVGYPERDPRPPSKANRAGTRGFRAPEVLLKCNMQTGAIDVWSAGIILLFFLTKKFPLFQASDDVEALMEIATIMGKKRMERAATLHSRVFQTNVPSVTQDGVSWSDFVKRLNPDIYSPPSHPDTRCWPYCLEPPNPGQSSTDTSAKPTSTSRSRHPPTSSSPVFSSGSHSRSRSGSASAPSTPLIEHLAATHAKDVDAALSLAEGLLHHDSVKRFTPLQALEHPFLRDPALVRSGLKEADVMPHPLGHGRCERLHYTDEQGRAFVKVWNPARAGGEGRKRKRALGEVRVGGRSRKKRASDVVDLDETDEDGESEEDEDAYVSRVVLAGEGIAIGEAPCEFHRPELGYRFPQRVKR